MAKKKMKKKGFMGGGMPMGAKPSMGGGGGAGMALGATPNPTMGGGANPMESEEERKKRILAQAMKKPPGMMKGGMAKKGFADGGLTGKQTKLDKNKDGKISGEDFKKMKGGGMAKKGYAKGGMAKKGYANGGVAKKKTKATSKGKVRGAGIAKKGVRKCKMR